MASAESETFQMVLLFSFAEGFGGVAARAGGQPRRPWGGEGAPAAGLPLRGDQMYWCECAERLSDRFVITHICRPPLLLWSSAAQTTQRNTHESHTHPPAHTHFSNSTFHTLFNFFPLAPAPNCYMMERASPHGWSSGILFRYFQFENSLPPQVNYVRM